jgi:hypothetical protein
MPVLTLPPSTDPAAERAQPDGDGVKFTGTDFFWILLSACSLMLLANGVLLYFATDSESDFRQLIDYLR